MGRPADPVSELRRGTLELAILAWLNQGSDFGGGIMAGLAKVTEGGLVLTEGALYPALHRLQRQGSLQSEWQRSEDGATRRRYYELTTTGQARLQALNNAWQQLVTGLSSLLANPVGGGASE